MKMKFKMEYKPSEYKNRREIFFVRITKIKLGKEAIAKERDLERFSFASFIRRESVLAVRQ